ncbi:MAG: mechanosensitive ion channel [Chitinophagales bacterium]|nr:mechanosensitive ion channel [Chitinophagales bacterium]
MDTTNLVTDFNGLSNTLLTKGSEILMEYGLKIAGAILIYIIGSWIIKNISKGLNKLLAGKKYDPSLQTFLRSLVSIGLNVLLIIVIIGQLGVNTTSFAGLLAGAAVAIGAALNGTLGNLAGGVMLLIFKPFKVGEMIEAQGAIGIVKELSIFNTIILSPENKTIILPNGPLSTGTITNYNSHGNLRVDLTMAVALDQNIDKARQIAIDAMLSHPKVLKTPAPEVAVLKVADGMTSLAVRPYTTQADYWDVYFGTQELVKNAWDNNGISGPIPHRVIIQK